MVEVVLERGGWTRGENISAPLFVEARGTGTVELVLIERAVLGSGKSVHGHGDGLEKWRGGGTEDEDYQGQVDRQ